MKKVLSPDEKFDAEIEKAILASGSCLLLKNPKLTAERSVAAQRHVTIVVAAASARATRDAERVKLDCQKTSDKEAVKFQKTMNAIEAKKAEGAQQ